MSTLIPLLGPLSCIELFGIADNIAEKAVVAFIVFIPAAPSATELTFKLEALLTAPACVALTVNLATLLTRFCVTAPPSEV